MKKAKVYMHNNFAGILTEDANGFQFQYDQTYLENRDAEAISLTLPLSNLAYESKNMFPFFDGLIPEGWLLDIAVTHWKVKRNDRFELLLTTCRDTIGAVTVEPE